MPFIKVLWNLNIVIKEWKHLKWREIVFLINDIIANILTC